MDRIFAVAFIFMLAGASVILVLQLTAKIAHAKGLNPPEWMTYPGALSVPIRLGVGLVILVFTFLAEPYLSNLPFFVALLGTTEAAK